MILMATTLSSGSHFIDAPLFIYMVRLVRGRSTYRIDVYHLLFRTYNLNMVALTISYQVGFRPCAVQVLQLFQPLYLLIMILQNFASSSLYLQLS
jgi:hypothetical protein